MEELKEYHNIIQEIWKLFKASMIEVAGITDSQDPEWYSKWKAICDNFNAIEKKAPQSMKDYAGSMVALHVDELERRWRH